MKVGDIGILVDLNDHAKPYNGCVAQITRELVPGSKFDDEAGNKNALIAASNGFVVTAYPQGQELAICRRKIIPIEDPDGDETSIEVGLRQAIAQHSFNTIHGSSL